MKILIRCFLFAGLVLTPVALVGPASASPPGPVHGKFMMPKEQPKLNAATVERVIQVLPELLKLTRQYRGEHSKGDSKKIAMNDRYIAFTKSLDALSKKHGFRDSRTMQKMVEATMMTTGFLKSGKTLKQVDDQMLATQKTIMDNPKLSPLQKDTLLQRMAIQVSMVVPTAQNIKTVKPFYERIIAIVGKK